MTTIAHSANIQNLGWCLKNLLLSEDQYRVIGIVESHLPGLNQEVLAEKANQESESDIKEIKSENNKNVPERIKVALSQLEAFSGEPYWGNVLEDNLNYASELFDLSRNERNILGFIMNSYKNSSLKKLGDDLLVLFKDTEKVVSILTRISTEDVIKAFVLNGTLQESGLIKVDLEDIEEGLCSQYGAIPVARTTVSSMFRHYSDKDVWISSFLGDEVHASITWEMFSHVGKELDVVLSMLTGYRESQKPHLGLNILLMGPPGTGKTELAKTLARSAGMNCWSVGEVDHQGNEPRRINRIMSLKTSLTLLQKNFKAVIMFDEAEDILGSRDSFGDEKGNVSKIYINNLLTKNKIPVIWTCNSIEEMDRSVLRRMSMIIEVKSPNFDNRSKIWHTLLKDNIQYPEGASKRLAKSWLIAPAIASSAVEVNRLANGNEETLNTIIGGIVSAMGTQQEPEYNSGVYDPELVVCRDDLNEVADKLLFARSAWNMCLHGPSGTGKSLYGRHLADKLGMKVIHRRASHILSKWSGETEKNIANLFTQAKIERKIIIIDEIESLVFDRRSAERAYDVSLVNEFLSQLDTHELPFIATTNLIDLIDVAMLRRFTFKFKLEALTPAKRNLAYWKILGIPPSPERELPTGLTPSDFKNVRAKMDILGVSDHATIARWLKEEVENKPMVKEEIGFSNRHISFKTD
jgi:SpoVK/Ycf46/Vps4 family AAA+-type ATPase